MEIKFVIMVAYIIGITLSIIQMENFGESQHRHRKIVKAAYIFCWAALVIPGLNLIGAFCLWWELRQAKIVHPEHKPGFIKVPEHYNCRSVAQPIDLGEDEHA